MPAHTRKASLGSGGGGVCPAYIVVTVRMSSASSVRQRQQMFSHLLGVKDTSDVKVFDTVSNSINTLRYRY